MHPNEALAQSAQEYARLQIKEASTYLDLEDEKRMELEQAIEEMRKQSKESGYYLSRVDPVLKHFEERIDNCHKLHIGNCHELALMGLYYILNTNPNTLAEVFCIQGGDHVFLVIGRKIPSDASDPDTWGPDAFFCDPWSQKVYPPKDHLQKTKNFMTTNENGVVKNSTEPFDPDKHILKPIAIQNSLLYKDKAREANALLVQVFEILTQRYVEVYTELVANLESIAQQAKKRGEHSPQYLLLREKINVITQITKALEEDCKNFKNAVDEASKSNTYLAHTKFDSDIQSSMKEKMQGLRESAKLSENESNTLKQFSPNDTTWSTKIAKFYNAEPKAFKNYQTSLKSAEEQIEALEDLARKKFRTAGS
jgi:hypothetical protein